MGDDHFVACHYPLLGEEAPAVETPVAVASTA
jgi:hypothetical protein